jgi:hypothetical protein
MLPTWSPEPAFCPDGAGVAKLELSLLNSFPAKRLLQVNGQQVTPDEPSMVFAQEGEFKFAPAIGCIRRKE